MNSICADLSCVYVIRCLQMAEWCDATTGRTCADMTCAFIRRSVRRVLGQRRASRKRHISFLVSRTLLHLMSDLMIMCLRNGDVFRGRWVNGKKHGHGIFTSGIVLLN